MSDNTVTIAVAVEELTSTFQLGETIAEAITQTVPTLPVHNDEQGTADHKVAIITNSAYLKGWCTQNGYDAELTDNDGLVKAIADNTVTIVILAPTIQTLGISSINYEMDIAIVAPPDNVLSRAQEELLRLDDDGIRIHDESWVALVIPPEYRMVQSTNDPDTYVRAIANPNYVNIKHDNNSDKNA